MDTLGQRIKSIRKSQKMTLVDLAGTQMTKGMLSLIENNKAQPSMENLNYIASKLNITVGELTDEIPTQQLRDYIDQLRLILPNEKEITKEKALQIEELLLPVIHRLPEKYESAQILKIYLKIFIPLNRFEEGIVQCDSSLLLLEKLSLYTDYVETLRKKSTILFFLEKYEEAYETIMIGYRMIQSNYYSIDLIPKIQALYHTTSMSLALDSEDSAITLIDDLIAYCHKEKIYFFYMHILRLATFTEATKKEPTKIAHYRKLVENYRHFDASNETMQLYYLYYVLYYSVVSNEPNKVIEYGHLCNELGHEVSIFIAVEMGKAYYLLENYDLAQQCFNQIPIDFNYLGVHPFDRSIFLDGFAYKALTHKQLNEDQLAIETITKAFNDSKTMSKTNLFVQETYHKLMKDL